MTTAAVTEPQSNKNGLRPLNVIKDLTNVADLVEECFAGTLDSEGRAAIDNFRRRGRDNSLLSWAPKMLDSISMPLSGFVWENDGRLVGNASLIPYYYQDRRVYLLANVATLPRFEGRGIASALTRAAVDKALEKGCDSIWLQVRADNERAINLYERAGFTRKYTRATWQLAIGHRFMEQQGSPNVTVIKTMSMDWQWLKELYSRAYPKELAWYNEYEAEHSRPGFVHSIRRLLRDARLRQNSAFIDGKLCGGVGLLNRLGYPEVLLLAMEEGMESILLPGLLASMAEHLTHHKKLTFELSPGEYDQMVFDMGFTKKRVLLWMKYIG